MNLKQRENTAKLLLDLIKIVVTVFVIGGLVPNSPIVAWQVIVSFGICAIMYVAAMFLLKRE
jgi:hypothetical protein